MKTFFLIWFGQLISMMGSGLTGFSLSVYIYQTTGSATQLGLGMLAATLPYILASPFAGALVDRWDRRWVMLLSDAGAGLSTLAIWSLLATGNLEIWHIYIANAVNAFFGAFQRPAYMAATTLLVPKEQYGRAAGLAQMGGALQAILAPLLAGFLIAAVQIQGVVLIDFATYLFATATLLLVRIPQPETSAAGAAGRGTLLREAGFGWSYIRQRPGLLGMLLLFAAVNFSLGFYSALFTPLILSFTTTQVLGTIFSVGGVGLLIGSLLMSAWGGPRRKVHSLLVSLFLFGLGISLTGLRADPMLIGAGSLFFLALVPIANSSSQAIWQAKVAPDVQGRVFATRAMIATAINPLAYLLAGPMADAVFEPIMAADGALAASMGQLIGVGPGRGIGLIFILLGILISLASVVGYLNPRIRLVEDELPDFESQEPESRTPEPERGDREPVPAFIKSERPRKRRCAPL